MSGENKILDRVESWAIFRPQRRLVVWVERKPPTMGLILTFLIG
jgi:hypothetical protein